MSVDRAWEIIVRTCWLGRPAGDVSDADLRRALRVARRNEVEASFVQAYADRLPDEAAEVRRAVEAYRRNLGEACARLAAAGVAATLIKALPDDDYTYSNFDLVVGDDGWERSIDALRQWAASTSRHPLERGTKLLLYPPDGPAVHLHREVAWFDVPAIPTDRLRVGARPAGAACCTLPSQLDAFRILLAHAAFQNLALTLGELLLVRRLAAAVDVAEAGRLAAAEGWERGFRSALQTARKAAARLDRLEPVPLPVPLPVAPSVVGGAEHAFHLLRTGRVLAAGRELALRLPLVAAKRRAARR